MIHLLDTSVIVRYLTHHPPEQAIRADELINEAESLTIPSVAIAETNYVLTKNYGISRERIIDALIGLIARESINVLDLPKHVVLEALELCRPSGRVSVADALIWAATRAADGGSVYTFDRRFPDSLIDRRVLR